MERALLRFDGVKRYYLARGYALSVGLGLFVLGLLGFTPAPPSFSIAENLLHIGTGSLFVAGAALLNKPNELQGFLFGMGILLVLATVLTVAARWPTLGLSLRLVWVNCLMVGVGSLLMATFAGTAEHPQA